LTLCVEAFLRTYGAFGFGFFDIVEDLLSGDGEVFDIADYLVLESPDGFYLESPDGFY